MSKRMDIVADFTKFLVDVGLNEAYGVHLGEIQRRDNPKAIIAYTLTFAKARALDGLIEIHDENKIKVRTYNSPQHEQVLVREDFTSPEQAKDYILNNFVYRGKEYEVNN